MFLDLSGFSTMTDTLMQHGQHGAEVLASLMHGVFDPLVESIFEYGGKIVSFAGDGIMALYPIDNDDAKQTALRALASAWVVQQRLMENPDRRTMYGKFTFSAKIGLTVGSVSWKILRSKDEKQATYYFRGSAVDEAARSEHQAKAGEIVVTDKLNELLGEDVRTRPNGSYFRFIRFRVEIPQKVANDFPPVDLKVSRIFMPEEVILEGVRGEFRQIANLFIRIPEVSESEMENFVNEIFELEKKYGGLVTRVDFGDKGCNMLLLWGAPHAYENDIGRALNFVLDLRSRMDFPITAGVTYYIAHAGYLGSELCEDYTCYGWGVNLAARFMMNAPDGEIWVDDRIAQRVSHRFALDYVGSQRFKGFAAEQKVHLLKYRKMESDVIYQGEMVGREKELRRLSEFIEPMWRGEFAGVMTVSGDAGIGKGRLIYEFSKSETCTSHKVLWANCKANQILRQSFNPIRGWLLQYFGSMQNEDIEERKKIFDAKLDDLLTSISDTELARELDRTRSFLGSLIDLHWTGSLYEQLDAEARYNNTILSLIALLKAESLRQPVILFVDDVQFIDEDTSMFLSQLKRSLQSMEMPGSMAIILTLRKQGVHPPVIDELGDFEIGLAGMPKPVIVKLVENILGGPASTNLMQLVLSRSEGNPYFAEQVIRYLKDENQLENGEKGWALAKRVGDSVLPGDIRAVLVARLDSLKREVKNTVQTASVLGREFEIGVLFQMLGSESTTKEYVAVAEKAAIWSQVNDVRYMFYHGLLRDAAYSMQMRARRQELHILALNALEVLYEDEPRRNYAELAYHAEQGDIRSKAQRYYTLAGRRSVDLYRNAEAIEYFTNALALTDFDDLETQFDLLAERVELYSRMGKRKLHLNDLEALEQRADQLKDSDRLARVFMFRSEYCFFVGKYQESIEYASKAENTSKSLMNSEQALYTRVVWCSSLLRLGRLDEAMLHGEETLERDRAIGNRRQESRILSTMGLIALEQKRSSQANEYFERALAISRDLNDKSLELRSLNNLAMLEGSYKGNYTLALQYYKQGYSIAKDIGDRNNEATILQNLGFAARMLGDFFSANKYYKQGLSIARESGNLFLEIYTLINSSALAGITGDAERALLEAQQAVELAEKTSDKSGMAWAKLYMGHAYLMREEIENAQDAFRSSIEIRRELGQMSLAMEPVAGLVETYMHLTDLNSASLEVEKILDFLESGETLDGTDEPLRVYYVCYRFLEIQHDPRAKQILQNAKELLTAQVRGFSSDSDRQRYIQKIPWRRAIWETIQSEFLSAD
ncbi:MAG: tetratricopeptide repeat protein [Anaerolineales bacterium]|nr:tetratricopeptide repeat protein [Anaerolineales bacterium]